MGAPVATAILSTHHESRRPSGTGSIGRGLYSGRRGGAILRTREYARARRPSLAPMLHPAG